jgi:hypothetical protein
MRTLSEVLLFLSFCWRGTGSKIKKKL